MIDTDIEIVAEDDERRRGNEAEADSRPLLIQRVLSDKDLGQLKELRVSNLMKL